MDSLKRSNSIDLLPSDVKKMKTQPMIWSDVFVLTLDHDEETGSKDKVSVSVGKQDNQIKSILTHLRRYKEGKPTTDGVALRLEDLKVIYEENEDWRSEADFCVLTPGHSLEVTCSKDEYPYSVKIAVGSRGIIKSITTELEVYIKFVRTLPTIRYIIGAISKKEEKTAEDMLHALLWNERSALFAQCITVASLESDVEWSMREVVKKMPLIERTLDIDHDIMVGLQNDPDLVKKQSRFQDNESDTKSLLKHDLTLILQNEVSL